MWLLALPALANVSADDLQRARFRVDQHPQQALQLAQQVLNNPTASGLQFQAKLLKGWALYFSRVSPDQMQQYMQQLKKSADGISEPLQKADWAFLRAVVEDNYANNIAGALPLLEEAMSYCRPFSQLLAYNYCAEITKFAAYDYAIAGKLSQTQTLITDSTRFARLSSRNDILLDIKLLKAALARRQNHYAEALKLLKETELSARQDGDKRHQGMALNRQATIYRTLGQNDKAEQMLMDALSLFDSTGADDLMAEAFKNLGELMLSRGKPQLAIIQFYNALDILNRNHQPLRAAQLLKDIGESYRVLDQPERARKFLNEARATTEKLHGDLYLPHIDYQLAQLDKEQGQLAAAIKHLQQTITGAQQNPTVERALLVNALKDIIRLYQRRNNDHLALQYAQQLIDLKQSPAVPSHITVNIKAPPAPPTAPNNTPSWQWWLLLFGAILLLLALAAWLIWWWHRQLRQQLQQCRQQLQQDPASTSLNMTGFLQHCDSLLDDLRDDQESSRHTQHPQPLAAILCYLPATLHLYERQGFANSRQHLRRFSQQLHSTLPEVKLLAQPSREYLLMVLPSPASGKERAFINRLRKNIAQATEGTAINAEQLVFSATLLPQLPFHPRVGNTQTLLETLLLGLDISLQETPYEDVWLLGQSCSLPSTLAPPLRSNLCEALRNGTFKLVGYQYPALMQRLDRLHLSTNSG
ncbi:tetratricopeptide repeat protein [Gallaecimonas sp. GXIMD1310]|uniref:tetratricopeptide repeat protein n=1 Tax=Gallaecimonas sp. GXIMD1310 TaxID=3131926 RepID=UPI003254C1A8